MTLARVADRAIFGVGVLALAYVAAVWLIEGNYIDDSLPL